MAAHIRQSSGRRRKVLPARAVSVPCLQADQVVSCEDGVRRGGLRNEGEIRTRSRGLSSRLVGWEAPAADLAGFGQAEGHRNHTDEGAPAAWSLASLANKSMDGSRDESAGMGMGMGSSFAKAATATLRKQ